MGSNQWSTKTAAKCGLVLTGLVTQLGWACPPTETIFGLPGVRFPDGSYAIRSGLAVNPDGAKTSYTLGDHGYTYVSNAIDGCTGGKAKQCRKDFLTAEAASFAKGTREFCVFAMEVEPIPPKTATVACGEGKKIIGNGKGRPVTSSDVLVTASGKSTRYYKSMTHLNELIGSERRSLDSMKVPMIVVPRAAVGALGQLAYVTYAGRDSFAVVGDTGPAFGEGSIALHEFLLYGSLQEPPPTGPIELPDRCGNAERSLRAPYASRPDLELDICRSNSAPRGGSDIRAWGGISSGVVTVVLAKSLPMKSDTLARGEVTADAIRREATDGFSVEQVRQMAACLNRG